MQYLKSFEYEEFKNDTMFEVLKEEFDSIINFKKSLLSCDIKDIEKMMEEIINI